VVWGSWCPRFPDDFFSIYIFPPPPPFFVLLIHRILICPGRVLYPNDLSFFFFLKFGVGLSCRGFFSFVLVTLSYRLLFSRAPGVTLFPPSRSTPPLHFFPFPETSSHGCASDFFFFFRFFPFSQEPQNLRFLFFLGRSRVRVTVVLRSALLWSLFFHIPFFFFCCCSRADSAC